MSACHGINNYSPVSWIFKNDMLEKANETKWSIT